MKIQLLLIACGFLNWGFGQTEKKQSFKNLFNEFQVSVNHGAANPKTFFGAGIGASHVFKPDRVVGSRVGLEVDFFHFWGGDITPPYSTETRRNQHFSILDYGRSNRSK